MLDKYQVELPHQNTIDAAASSRLLALDPKTGHCERRFSL